MELYTFLMAIIPGMIIFIDLRNDSVKKQNEPEYIILIRGLLYSMPFIGLLLFCVSKAYPQVPVKDSVLQVLWNYKFVFAYFISMLLYSKILTCFARFWKKKLSPYFHKKIATLKKETAYDCEYEDAWQEICELYMKKYDCVVCRIVKNSNVIGLGQISFIPNHSESQNKSIGLVFEKEYTEYFPADGEPLLENLCNYVDIINDCKIELYRGEIE